VCLRELAFLPVCTHRFLCACHFITTRSPSRLRITALRLWNKLLSALWTFNTLSVNTAQFIRRYRIPAFCANGVERSADFGKVDFLLTYHHLRLNHVPLSTIKEKPRPRPGLGTNIRYLCYRLNLICCVLRDTYSPAVILPQRL
jgi:hypothetical protein